MKNIYTALFTGTALLLAVSSEAQKTATHQPLQFTTLHPVHAAGEMRGGGAPPNDECTGATVHPLTIGTDLVITGDNTGGTDSEGIGFATTWEAFSLTSCADVQISYCGTNPAFGNFALGIGDCPITMAISPSASDDCGDGNILITYQGVPAGTWYIPVLVEDGSTGPYTITITSTSCPAPPANDNCDGAMALTAGTTCVGTTFTTAGATQSLDPIECNGYTSANANDVFFTFVATATNMTVGVVGYNSSDAVIELFEGSCDALTSLGCADETFPQSSGETTVENLNSTALTVGTTYTVRVYDWGHTSPDHNFEICVVEGTGSSIGIAEHQAADFTIYPNPGTGMFNLQYAGLGGKATVEVTDVTGRIIRTKQANVVNGTLLGLDLTGVSPGNYNVRLTVDGVRTEQRLMVK